MPIIARSAGRLFPVLLLALVIGCEEDVVNPLPPPAPRAAGYYPLTVGTTWVYASRRLVRLLSVDGRDLFPPKEQHATTTREIVVVEAVAGQAWAVEEERFLLAGSTAPSVFWRRYREDPTGLYRADLSAGVPPGGAAGEDTLTAARRFAYPREIGAVWRLRENQRDATATLVAVEPLSTALGDVTTYLVAYHLPGDGPDDRRHFWYSACGVIRSEVHTEVEAYDALTGERVTLITTETSEITAVLPACLRPGITRRGRRTGARPAPVPR